VKLNEFSPVLYIAEVKRSKPLKKNCNIVKILLCYMIELCHDRFEVFLFLFTLKEKKRKHYIRCAKVELVEKE